MPRIRGVTDDAPYRISDREVHLAITGYFMPTQAPNVPVLVGMPGTDDLFILVFSSKEKLVSVMESLGIGYEHTAIVTSGHELLADIKTVNESGDRPYRIRLAVDVYKADNGRVRFLEAQAPEESP